MIPLLILNIKESQKKHALLIEVNLGNGRVNKSHTYSGPLQICKNVSEIDNSILREFLTENDNSLLQKGLYYINSKNYTKFVDLALEGVLFYRSKEKKYVMIDTIKKEVPEKLSDYYFEVENYCFCIISSILYIWDNSNNLNTIIRVEPKVILYTDLNNKKYDLCFKYGIFEISFCNENDFLVNKGESYVRDKSFEKTVIEDLKNNGWKVDKDKINFIGSDIVEEINRSISMGYTVLTPKGKKIYGTRAYSYEFSYNMDWFDLNGEIITQNHKYDLIDFIQRTSSKQRWIELDGEVILINKDIEKFRFYSDSGKIKIPHSRVGDVLYVNSRKGGDNKELLEKIEFEKCNIASDNKIFDKLRDYQKYGVKWLLYMYKNKMGCCLADDMGLGKTVQIISFLSDRSIRSDRCSIVIVPKTLIYNWKREILKFNPEMKINIYHGKNRRINDAVDIVLTTYGTLIHDVTILSKEKYNCVIMDECQYAKNDKSLTYSCLERLEGYIKIALSGTPMENNLVELWSMMNLLNEGIFDKSELTNLDSNLKDIKIKIAPFILRRKKCDVLKELPQKEIVVVSCAMEKEQEDLYNTIFEATKLKINKYPNSIGSIILEDMLYLRECCCHPKLLTYEHNINDCDVSCKFEVLKQIIEQCTSSGNKIVVFSQFKKMLQIIEKWLELSEIESFVLTGETDNREKVIDEFEKSKASVFLISLKAGGVGINLTSAHYAVIYDPWWNPAVEEQAEDRLYRIGQENNVTIYKLIVANTIEEKIYQLQQKKSELSDSVLKGRENVASINKDIIEAIFK